MSHLLMCAACLAERPNDTDAAWQSEWATTIYRGNGLCLPHFREVRVKEEDARLRAQNPPQ